jgi:hypothetical protein
MAGYSYKTKVEQIEARMSFTEVFKKFRTMHIVASIIYKSRWPEMSAIERLEAIAHNVYKE